ncbi:radical SAM protein [Hymenobacter sp. BT507]|uniref:Radical SAM protein n=1 Tax=Hymenobacter citatus TaxID=2763506 RepID=A0ABR7MK39_9BACT|nr:radical SAM protein [Hymenobacter citatus]MBC6611447.1 radical SAM protein [Hymenobacter citatus]
MRLPSFEHPIRLSRPQVLWKLTKAALDRDRPVLVQIVVTRRCNLACGYCYEYDKVSKPVPLAELKARVDALRKLKTVFVTLNGGEPLLHPHIAELVRYIAEAGMVPMINTNGHVLKAPLIKSLNEAGLFGMQLSCDSLEDNDVTEKSMRRLRPKLELLREHARFMVRVNGVLGSGNPAEMEEVAKVVVDFGFDFQCSLMRDSQGQALPLSAEAQQAYRRIRALKGRLPHVLHDNFQLPLARGESKPWKCRAGARHFEVDGAGLVHLCQPRTGFPAKALADYSVEDIRRQFDCGKACAARCPIAYAHLGSRLDGFRRQQNA